jgi:Ca-activated chloride channel family protein
MKMRSTIHPVLVGITAAAILTTGAGAQQKIRTSTQTVPIYATVTDDERRLVPDLEQQDFEVYDNGKLQVLTNFDNKPTPFTAVVMLDTSGSMTLALDLVKHAAEQFLLRMLPEDRAMVGAFNDKIQFEPDTGVTANRDQLIRALKDLDFGYPTRLYDAVDQSVFRLREADGRKVVVVFTDGDDTASKIGMGDALERARIEDVLVYAIGLQSEYFNGQQRVRSRPDRGLKKLAEETGGGYFELKKTDELGPTFTRVAQELHSQYVIGFSPQALDGKVHKLEIKMKKPGMTARARKSYVAAPAGTQTEK